VLDASRSVGVVGNLVNPDRRKPFVEQQREDYAKLRASHANRQLQIKIIPIDQARTRKLTIDWAGYAPPTPALIGTKNFPDYPLADLVDCIDWTPFFKTWELQGKYPGIFDDPTVGKQARTLYDDATKLLERIVCDKLLTAKAAIGFFPANAVDYDDIALYADDSRVEVTARVHCLRQQFEKPPGRPNVCLTDFVAPRESGLADYIGAFVVTTGIGLSELCADFEEHHDDYNSILAKALADRLAEALAERMHERVRREFWGYEPNEQLANDDRIAERYRGIRPAPGYPSCPDHTEKRTLFSLLDAEAAAGVRLTEHMAMFPAASVSGWYFSHPDAYYFGLGKIGRDQVRDYATRKGLDASEMERWLSPNLAYEPD
jgi:5-methyltetrahydrofolate--homocysteine methyltransferase